MIQNKATVIIPCYNVEDYVAECLDSVREQGAVVHHVYCVNNNSSDRTVAVIEAWRAQHLDVRLTLLDELKPGAPAARNAPLASIETEWIQFLDADDLLLPGKVQRQIDEAQSETGMIFDSSIKRSVDGVQSKTETDQNVMVALMARTLGNTCANLFRTVAVRAVGGWNEALSSSQEYDLMYRLHSVGTLFQRMDTARTIIRERTSGQMSQSNTARRKRNSVELRERMLESFDLEALSAPERQRLLGAFFLCLHWLYQADPRWATDSYQRYLSRSEFEIEKTEGLPHAYALLFSLLGFAATERIWLRLKAMKKSLRRLLRRPG